ncbi:nuclear telomere cap complex subunit Ten1, partial [Aspergillus homomorphus CBS 101889]
MNAPLPSTRSFLSDLPSHPIDSKVRFLGCVRTYLTPTGHLILEHNYPHRKPPQQPPSVLVDINAVLESVTSTELRVGAWVSVLGYVRRRRRDAADADAAPAFVFPDVYIEAVLVIPAGAVALGEYERILQESLEVERRVRR